MRRGEKQPVSRFLLRYSLVLTAAWLLLMVVARALGGSVGGQEWILTLSAGQDNTSLELIDPDYSLVLSLNNRVTNSLLFPSPNGRYVSYQVNTENGSQRCELRDLYANAKRLHQTETGKTCEMVWSSDSQRILFLLTDPLEFALKSLEWLDLKTGAVHQVPIASPNVRLQRWIGAFNGTQINFYNFDGPDGGVVLQADVSSGIVRETRLTGGWGGTSSSADGRWSVVPLTRDTLTTLYLLDTLSGAWTAIDHSVGSVFPIGMHWHADVFIYMRNDTDLRTTYWRFDPLSGEKVMVWEPTGEVFSFSPDADYMAIQENGLRLMRWNEVRQRWDELFQTEQPVSVVEWLDAHTLMVIDSNAAGYSLWVYNAQTGARWDVYIGREWITPSRWTLDSHYLWLYLTDSNQKVSLVAANRQTRALTTLIPPNEFLFDITGDSSELIRVVKVFEFSTNRVDSLQIDLHDLRVMTIQPTYDWSGPLHHKKGPKPGILFFHSDDQGIDLYLLDTDQAVATPLLTDTQINPNATFWVYPSPP